MLKSHLPLGFFDQTCHLPKVVASFVADILDRQMRLLADHPVDLGFDAGVGELAGDHLGVGFAHARHRHKIEEFLHSPHREGPEGPLKRPLQMAF